MKSNTLLALSLGILVTGCSAKVSVTAADEAAAATALGQTTLEQLDGRTFESACADEGDVPGKLSVSFSGNTMTKTMSIYAEGCEADLTLVADYTVDITAVEEADDGLLVTADFISATATPKNALGVNLLNNSEAFNEDLPAGTNFCNLPDWVLDTPQVITGIEGDDINYVCFNSPAASTVVQTYLKEATEGVLSVWNDYFEDGDTLPAYDEDLFPMNEV